VLLRPDVLAAIAEGRVDLAFRRWERPRVRVGGTQRTAVGVIGFERLDVVEPDAITDEEARRAGFADREALLTFLDRRAAGVIHRVELRVVGPDPRVRLRERLPDDAELGGILRRLERLDRASRHGPWTTAVLRAIGERPATRAGDLALAFGRERLAFKSDVRKLKELGLTESLERGYRLSPRGRTVLQGLIGGVPRPAPSRTTPSQRRRREGR
jgi:hypothetical protein